MSAAIPVRKAVPWHATGISAVAEALGTDPASGLDQQEVARRLDEHGPNQLAAHRAEPWWEEVLESLREPLQLLLLAVGAVYALLGEFADAATIFAVILCVSLVEAFNELRAKRAIRSLASLAAPNATVVRGGAPREVASRELVPGDVVLLAPGIRVAADLRLTEAIALRIDESSLTGESLPASKDAGAGLEQNTELGDRCTMAYATTLVTAGKGRGIVVATGQETEVGHIAGLVEEAREPPTPLQQAMRQLSGWLLWAALGFSLGVPLLGVLIARLPLQAMLLTGLTLAFATIPEELPILITIVLGIGAYRLAQRHAIVRKLQAAETLGSITVVATDKTGTLTANEMRVAEVVVGNFIDAPSPFAHEGLHSRLLEAGVLANDAELIRSGDALEIVGDPTDVALLKATNRSDLESLRESTRILEELPFDDVRKRMSVVCERSGRRFIATKGAPEKVLEICSSVVTDVGVAVLDPATQVAVEASLSRLTERGMRVLALATRELTSDGKALSVEAVEQDLTLLGLVGLEDPPRPEAFEAVKTLTAAGVRVIMLTGDHPATARAIAARVGIPAERVVLGRDLDSPSDGEVADLAESASVFARIAPQHKMRIVRGLQSRGELVAVTGDGVNDAPALREAAIGIAMGQTGTDVAREAADMVLADDNLATITEAVRTGRTLYANLRKAVRYYLAAKVALVFASLVAVLLRLPVPFEPVQIIVMELFMDVGASATFVVEPPEDDAMKRPPRDPRQPFINRGMQLGILLGGLALGSAVLLAYLAARFSGGEQEAPQSAAFVAWMIGHVVLAAHMRSERQPLLVRNPLENRPYLLWVAAALAVVLVGFTVPVAAQRLHLTELAPGVWAVAIASAVLVPSLWEPWKWLHHWAAK